MQELSTSEVISAAVEKLCLTFGKDYTQQLVDVYQIGLDGLTPLQIAKAIRDVLQGEYEFMPRPGTLRKIALADGISHEARALVEWNELETALSRYSPRVVNGKWGSTDGSDMGLSPLCVAIANSIGGFMRLKDMPESELCTWKRKDFIAAYVALLANPERVAAIAGPKSEIGLALTDNMKDRFTAKPDDEQQLENMQQLLEMLN